MSNTDQGNPAEFAIWLPVYLKQVQCELDIDVLGEYVLGILEESNGVETSELHSDISELLYAYMPTSLANSTSKTIVERYFLHKKGIELTAACQNSTTGAVENVNLTLEERMRALLVAERTRIVQQQNAVGQDNQVEPSTRGNRDNCTLAVLREAGVAGYQTDSDEERSVEIAAANAEFQAKQRLNATVTDIIGGDVSDNPIKNGDANIILEEVDMDELEELSGYGRKLDTKPGTVADALAEFRPTTPITSTFRQIPPQVSSRGPMNLTLPIFTSSGPSGRTSCIKIDKKDTSDGDARKKCKKKSHIISKHIARVGAQAEADTKRQQAIVNVRLHGVCTRQEEMDAFLFDDVDYAPGEILAGGKNHGRLLATEMDKHKTATDEATERRARDRPSNPSVG